MEVIKKYWVKYWKAIVAIIVIILFALAFSFLVSTISTLKSQKANLIYSKDSSFLVASYYKNKNGELVNQVNTYELTTKDLKQIGERLGFDNKQLKDQVGNLKNLVAHWKGQASTHGSDTVRMSDTVYLDNVGNRVVTERFDWTNKYLSLNGTYFPETKRLAFQYNYDLGGFDITSYYKSTGFLKPKQLVADIKFGDPNMKVTQFQGFVIEQPKKKWFQTKAFYFGIGVLGGGYLALRYR